MNTQDEKQLRQAQERIDRYNTINAYFREHPERVTGKNKSYLSRVNSLLFRDWHLVDVLTQATHFKDRAIGDIENAS